MKKAILVLCISSTVCSAQTEGKKTARTDTPYVIIHRDALTSEYVIKHIDQPKEFKRSYVYDTVLNAFITMESGIGLKNKPRVKYKK